MTSFVEKVQKSKVKTPFQNSFDRLKWEKAFSSLASPSQQDIRLYEAGIWFHSRLEKIRSLGAGLQDKASPDELVRRCVGLTNWYCRRAAEESGKQLEARAGQLVWAHEMLEIGSPAPGVPLAAFVEAVVDALRIELPQLRLMQGAPLADPNFAVSMHLNRLQLSVQYYLLAEVWSECVWHGAWVKQTDEADFILPPLDSSWALDHTISVHRRDMLRLQMSQVAMAHMDDDPHSIEALRMRTRITGLRREKRGLRLVLGDGSVGENSVRRFALLQILSLEEYVLDLLDQQLPSLGVTLKTVLEAWGVLSPLADLLHARSHGDAGRTGRQLEAYAPAFARSEFIKVIRAALGLSHELAKRVLDLFCWPGTARDDSWSYPLIPLSDERLTLVVPVLQTASLSRLVENWMDRGGLDLDQRGPLFEKFMRRKCREAIAENKMLASSGVAQGPVDLDSSVGDLDVVLWLGTTVLVCEAKCHRDVVTSLEEHHHRGVLVHAAEQLSARRKFIDDHPEVLREKLVSLGYVGDAKDVHYAILTNLPQGTLAVVDGFPVVDVYLMTQFLSSNIVETMVITDAQGHARAEHFETLYESEVDAGRKLPGYLVDPPHLRYIREHAKLQVRPIMALEEGEKRVATVGFSIGSSDESTAEEEPLVAQTE